MEEAIETEEVTSAETAPESPTKDEPDAFVQEAVVRDRRSYSS